MVAVHASVLVAGKPLLLRGAGAALHRLQWGEGGTIERARVFTTRPDMLARPAFRHVPHDSELHLAADNGKLYRLLPDAERGSAELQRIFTR